MKLLVTVMVWFFVPLLLIEASTSGHGLAGANRSAHDLAALGCSVPAALLDRAPQPIPARC
ncbi:MAG TPA: hypothetical protein VGN14_02395 [Candidatus Elarobacter sp.]|jgi:hypothetical protein